MGDGDPGGGGDEPGMPLSHDPVQGQLAIGGHRYLLIRPETLGPLCRSDQREVQKLLYAGGEAGGVAAAGSVLTTGAVGRNAFVQLLEVGAGLGWGRFHLESWEPERVAVTLTNGAFVQAARPAAQPGCHTVRGVLAGMITVIRGAPYTGVETNCAACGDESCTFELRPAGDRKRDDEK